MSTAVTAPPPTMGGQEGGESDSLYPIAVLIDELRNEDVQVLSINTSNLLL